MLRKLGEMAVHRFLSSPYVSVERIVETLAGRRRFGRARGARGRSGAADGLKRRNRRVGFTPAKGRPKLCAARSLTMAGDRERDAERLFNLAALGLAVAVRIIQLVDARNGGQRPATDVIDPDFSPALKRLSAKLEGKTARQKNPHPPDSLAFLAWIAARLGGWNCYYKPPGPKTMRHGWTRLYEQGSRATPSQFRKEIPVNPVALARGRIAAIDLARGAALIGMAAYHLSWDLAYFGLAPPDFPLTPPMRLFSHLVAGTFLALVGVSLVLAHHREGLQRRAFQRRFALICGAAALVTGASLVLAPQYAIYFGVLHCIAAASLLAAPLLEAPVWTAYAAAGITFAAPLVFANPAFNQPAVIWLGLNTIPPSTFDWRPLAPWAGMVFLGLALARLFWRLLTQSALAQWRPRALVLRAVAWAGRHSLLFYLVHQPVLFALLFAATGFASPEARRDEGGFRGVCLAQCARAGGTTDHCQRGCQCVVDGLRGAGLTLAFSTANLDETQHTRFSSIVQGCARVP